MLTFILLLISTLASNSFGIPIEKASRRTPTLLVSLDGFQATKLDEFLSENPNSYLNRFFVNRGVKASHLKPSFTTLTFPNHYTLITGLYQESHGVIDNQIYDPDLDKRINFLGDPDSDNEEWWNQAEPIWLTAKRQGFKTGSFFWTGSEVWGRHPDIFFKYQTSLNYFQRCDEVVGWFKKFDMDFATLYFNEPDSTGHKYGPDSPEYMQKIHDMDEIIGYLITQFSREDLIDKVNIVLVSDHGMATMSNTIPVEDLIDVSWVNSTRTVWGIVSSVWPARDDLKTQVHDELKKSNLLTVYYKENMPPELNYKNNNRIGPIVAIANEGYIVVDSDLNLKGNHGFDNRLQSMQAIFLARGPDFKHNVKLGSVNNVDVYPLLCELVNVKCNPNNGTIAAFKDALNFTPLNAN